jgi:hypothetical protein
MICFLLCDKISEKRKFALILAVLGFPKLDVCIKPKC